MSVTRRTASKPVSTNRAQPTNTKRATASKPLQAQKTPEPAKGWTPAANTPKQQVNWRDDFKMRDLKPTQDMLVATRVKVVDLTKAVADWRGGEGTPIRAFINKVLERINNSPNRGVSISSDTPASMFIRGLLNNHQVTNEQLLAMAKVTLAQMSTSPEGRRDVLKRIPDVQSLPVHKFTVAMMAAITGVDEKALSNAAPDLGLTGSAGGQLLYASTSPETQRTTALHDLTETMHEAGIAGLNTAVWGAEDKATSAVRSFVTGLKY